MMRDSMRHPFFVPQGLVGLMIPSRRAVLALTALGCIPASLTAQTSATESASAYLESVRTRTPELVAFLRAMPKGGDLHSHLSGAVYAESVLRWAAEDGACIDTAILRIVPAPCTPGGSLVSAQRLAGDGDLHGRMVDVMSMRNWNAARLNGHDQFFGTFARLEATDRRTGDMLAEVQERAAAGGVSYLELMTTPDRGASRLLGDSVGFDGNLDATHRMLMERGTGRIARAASARLDSIEARRDTVLGCGTPAARPGCQVTVRWLYQVLRASAPRRVYSQLLTGFVMAERDPRVVGLNMVQPEDYPIAMGDYSLHMRMVGYLRGRHPRVSVSLHAGELAPGLVPPDGLRGHIREAVRVAGARRIGHGVDVMHEDSAAALLREMAERRVMVEIALTSNDVILGVRGDDHPLRTYLQAGVPVALATDDEGVSRSEMTMEYVRAVQDQGLDYPTLKRMARTSLEYAFEPGESIWESLADGQPARACAGGWSSASCEGLARRSSHARLQRDLELAFERFEAGYPRPPR
jgi:adenosine deaminase